jgi:glutamate-1-semialdehyde aminotransferase
MGKGQELYNKAKQLIPGGTMLLSKRPEMFLPDFWPAYYSKAKGCKVWDLDENEYTDVSIMGIGTNILGYCRPEVDEAVISAVRNSNMSTFNCPEEVELAERLIDLHQWADMVRFARSGGEANAIAIRIARAASGKDKVAICGYHGWHDWYLATNLGDNKNLDGHLLPGLNPEGVPQGLKDTIYPFNYNDFQQLLDIVNENDIGVIKMEVSRNYGPEDRFLQRIRDLATEKKIVLIFDECTSGFRQTFGGLHKLYGVDPDMAIFGKALGNGYAITAVIGKREIMEAAQRTFISSTFWTERIGPSAALATLRVMEAERSWECVTNTGLMLKQRWQKLADAYNMPITQWGIPALAGFSFNSERSLYYKTYLTQEMLKKGFLASNSIYVSIVHTPQVIDAYFEAVEPIFADIADYERKGDALPPLMGPVCHAGFKRLN